MSATNEVLKYFMGDFKKRNVGILMEMIFPEDGAVVERGRIKGEIGQLGWKIKPQAWWVIKCNKTNKCYRIHFKLVETSIGGIEYFNTGKGFYNYSFVKDENNLRQSIGEFINDRLEMIEC